MPQQNPYQVVLSITLGLLLIYWFKRIDYILFTSLTLGLVSLLSNWAANKIAFGWIKLAHLLSLVFPPTILAVIYLTILTPLALMAKLSRNKDELNLKNQSSTLFKEVTKSYTPQTFEKMW